MIMGRFADRGRDHFLVDDNDAQIIPADIFLQNHRVTHGFRFVNGLVQGVGSRTSTLMPAPCSPRAGLTTTEPCSSRNASACVSSSTLICAGTRRPPGGVRDVS